MPVVNRVPCTGSATQIGIVHLGLGAFHRAHQAVYLQRHLNRHGTSDWGLCSANLRSITPWSSNCASRMAATTWPSTAIASK